MKLSHIINYPLSLFGLKLVRLSNLKKLQSLNNKRIADINDIEKDKIFLEIFEKVRAYTLVDIERAYALHTAVKYVIDSKVKGDFVECGVWKGGSAMLIAYTLMKIGVADRKIFMYDTFEGMVMPGSKDGEFEMKEWERMKVNEHQNNWCLSPIEEVRANMLSTAYPQEHTIFVKGKVEETIPTYVPSRIALLRLDTDWYESTKHELIHLYPLLEKNAVLIIDDYGTWEGSKKATEEYFAANGPVFLNRIDFSGRLIIK